MELAEFHSALFALIALGGCLGPSSSNCANGTVCPVGQQCALNGEKQTICVAPTCGTELIEAEGGCHDRQSHDGCSSRCTVEIPSWASTETAPAGRSGQAMAYDAARGRVVLFAGSALSAGLPTRQFNDTWEWDGALWRERTPMTMPPVRTGHAMAYDADHERIVMYGGDSTGPNSTWEWDGGNWIERRSTHTPPAPLFDAAMTYDAARQRVVLFGGQSAPDTLQGFHASTWEWDGTTWQERITAGPSPRAAPAMTYDSKSGKVVLFGGGSAEGVLDDTWEYDGTTWAQKSTSGAPGPRQHAGMAFDAARGKVVLFGGIAGKTRFTDTWEWDGSQWTAKMTNVAPQAPGPITYDIVRGKVVLFGETSDGSEVTHDTWEWDGEVWIKRAVGRSPVAVIDSTSPAMPSPRSRQAMTYDATRATTVMFGGRQRDSYLSDTWLWNGLDWREQLPPMAPPARAEHAMAFDISRSRTVMFGGARADPSSSGATTLLDDTWEWDGATWQERTPTTRPMARQGHAMVYDVERAKTLLIGGKTSNDLGLDDQCEWDGTSWTCATPAVSPVSSTTRFDFALAYDAARRTVVLYGGRATPELLLEDTWEWDGQNWTDRTPRTGPVPSARTGHTLSYDTTRQRVVLFGGQTRTGAVNETWEWDGTSWTELDPEPAPVRRHHHAMIYDTARKSLVMFGGADDTTTELGDSWFFRYEDPTVPDEACHTGLDYDGDGLAGCEDPDCAGLCAHCGDGICDAVEDCGLCPRDCGVCGSVCGDLQCSLGETHSSCPGDCPPPSTCGDEVCDPSETCSSCSQDCGACN